MCPTDIQLTRLPDGSRVMIRAIRGDDAPMLQAFVSRLSARSRHFRFFVARSEQSEGPAIIAEARCVLEDDLSSAEFAIAVADEFQRQGLGTQLAKKLMTYASGKGV